MLVKTFALRRRTSCARVSLLFATAFVAAAPVFAQQSYVGRYDAFLGYGFLDSPKVGLFENGVQGQVGMRLNRWLSMGFDYTNARGDLTLTPDLLLPSLQQTLGAQLGQLAAAGRLPSGYTLTVPARSVTQTFAAGPQVSYRRTHYTLFVRPSMGAIREVATPHPADAIAAAISSQLAPEGNKSDWKAFYGFGGGIDIILSRHWAWRTQADLVYDHLFDDLLKDGRLTVRFSIGPTVSFGRNIAK